MKETNLIDHELERKAIASVLADETLVDDLIEKLDENCFMDPPALAGFNWIKKQYANHKKISLIRMRRETDIDLEKIVDSGILLMEYDVLLEILLKLKVRRRLMKSARKIYKLAQREDLEIEEYEHKAQEIIFNSTAELKNEDRIFELEDSLIELYGEILEIQNGEKTISGLGTGFPSIDHRTSGLQKGHLVVIGAKTSMGKTAFAAKLMHNILKRGHKGIFISLEMKHSELTQRLLVLDSRVPSSAYNRKGLTMGQKANMDESFSRLMDLNLTISDKRGLKVEDIRARCRKIARKRGQPDFIIIDYLQRIPLPGGNEFTSKKIGEVVNNIRDMAGELNCPVLLISQLKRYGEGKPQINHLRNSGEIEEVADDIWLLYRPNYDEDAEVKEEIQEGKVIIAKGRTSGTEVCDFVWYEDILCWRDEIIEKTEGPITISR